MRVFRKISAILLSICILFGVLALPQNTKVSNAASDPVKMYYIDYYGGRYGFTNYNVYIKINHNAQNKAVYLHYYTQNGQYWDDKAAEYVTTLSDGSEIWKATPNGPIGVLFAIKYVGDGVTYWDNNNGNDYDGSTHLGDAAIKVSRQSYSGYTPSANLSFTAEVKNIAYNKVVKVRYTQDNWATYTDLPLSYSFSNTSTNNTTEFWTGNLSLDPNKLDSFHYCLYYTVNGVTYWDNNFGANYDINYRTAPY